MFGCKAIRLDKKLVNRLKCNFEISGFLDNKRMKLKFTVIVTFCISLLMIGCGDEVTMKSRSSTVFYHETGGEKLENVISLNDGGFLYFGSSLNRGFAMRVSADGTKLWYKIVEASVSEIFEGAVELPGGKFILVGTTEADSESLDKEAGTVVQLSGSGEVEWNKVYSGDDDQSLKAVTITPENHIVATGYVIPSDADTWILKLNMDGAVIWSRDYTMLSPWHDVGTSIIVTSKGNYAVCGISSPNSTAVGNGNMDTYLLAVDPNTAEIAWGRPHRSFPNSDYNWRYPKVVEVSNGFMWANSIYDQDSILYIQLVKTDLGGVAQFDKRYYGLGSAEFGGIQKIGNDEIIINGNSREISSAVKTGNSMVLRINAAGEELWSAYHGENSNLETCKGTRATPTGFVHAGNSLDSKGVNTMMLYRTDKNGNLLE